MKIAVVAEDGIKLSSHFGTASSYRIFTVEDGKIILDEMIDKLHHEAHQEHGQHSGHKGMKFFDPIKDCQVLLAGGMDEPAHKCAQSFGFDVIMTGGKIDVALNAYLSGELVSDQRRAHRH